MRTGHPYGNIDNLKTKISGDMAHETTCILDD